MGQARCVAGIGAGQAACQCAPLDSKEWGTEWGTDLRSGAGATAPDHRRAVSHTVGSPSAPLAEAAPHSAPHSETTSGAGKPPPDLRNRPRRPTRPTPVRWGHAPARTDRPEDIPMTDMPRTYPGPDGRRFASPKVAAMHAAAAAGQLTPATPSTHGRNCPCTSTSTTGRRRSLWHTSKGPYPLLADHAEIPHELRKPEFVPSVARWVDHPYMLRESDGTWTYVAEPYSITAADLPSLQALAAAGFTVTISADNAMHAPGQTIAVTIRQNRGGQR